MICELHFNKDAKKRKEKIKKMHIPIKDILHKT